MLLSWDFGMPDAGYDPIYVTRIGGSLVPGDLPCRSDARVDTRYEFNGLPAFGVRASLTTI